MNDQERLEAFKSNSAPCTETLGMKVLSFSSQPPSIEMEFEAKHEFTHSEGRVVQGGFVTGMLDAPMAHLLMGIFDFKISLLFKYKFASINWILSPGSPISLLI